MSDKWKKALKIFIPVLIVFIVVVVVLLSGGK